MNFHFHIVAPTQQQRCVATTMLQAASQAARQAGPLPDYADKKARRLTFLNYTEKRNLREMQFAEREVEIENSCSKH